MGECTCTEPDWIRFDCPVHCPEHLREDAMHYTCTGCGRKTWSRVMWHQTCNMTQPDGARCIGRFE